MKNLQITLVTITKSELEAALLGEVFAQIEIIKP